VLVSMGCSVALRVAPFALRVLKVAQRWLPDVVRQLGTLWLHVSLKRA
jgi:hypothetical protein